MILLHRVVIQCFRMFRTLQSLPPFESAFLTLRNSPQLVSVSIYCFSSLHPLSPSIHFLFLGVLILDTSRIIQFRMFVLIQDTSRIIQFRMFVIGGSGCIFVKFFCVVIRYYFGFIAKVYSIGQIYICLFNISS